ncbi:MAG: hypothetical protein A3H96_16290 [Acidobacteria bacterium RIFCSPLOWO2_02_FULL_67_36]|nr:MAG: hypothetical protein A3H96_16290 [Acidobacteria bacterium RIFCSPLOWO2_02_FULL_67_36]OFW21275.1 MAG: hypothetical protein A3G21_11505 [Acidobacteria bacterium RIFCSPLOWO2_12_FULL_66_21]
MTQSHGRSRGFTLIELMLTVAVAATIMAMAVPVMTDITASIKLNEATRTVERELQNARLKAVSTNRAMRVRTNCPSTGYLRTVEVIGTSADNASDRCLQSAYPYPPTDVDAISRPNFDGPVRSLPNEATVTSSVLEFRPDGTVRTVVSGVAATIVTPVTLTITRRSNSRTVTINGVGKIQVQQ